VAGGLDMVAVRNPSGGPKTGRHPDCAAGSGSLPPWLWCGSLVGAATHTAGLHRPRKVARHPPAGYPLLVGERLELSNAGSKACQTAESKRPVVAGRQAMATGAG
jgi:hypothetical protein